MIPLRRLVDSLGNDAGRGSDERGVVLLPRHRGQDRRETSAAGDAATGQCGTGRARREVFRVLQGGRTSVYPAGALAAGCAAAASLFDPLGPAIGRTVGIRHAVSLVRRALLDEKVFDASTFAKNRDRLLTHAIAQGFLGSLLALPEVKGLLSAEHFSVGGTLLKAWASMKSFRPKSLSSGEDSRNGSGEPPSPRRNGETNFRKTKRSNETPASTTDKDTRLYCKGDGQESRHCYLVRQFLDTNPVRGIHSCRRGP